MADNQFKYTLEFDSRATGDGAQKTTAGIHGVSAASEALRAKQAGLLTAMEREVAEVERLVASARKLAAEKKAVADASARMAQITAETTHKISAERWGVYDLDASLKQVRKTSAEMAPATATMTSGVTSVGAGSKNSAQALLMFSQGLEDAQYGIRGVLNNIPGLVMALGGGMGVAGAISIAAVAFSQLWTWFGKTGDGAKNVALDLDQIAGNAGERLTQRLEQQREAIDLEFELAEASRQTWDATVAAANAAATAQIDNAGKVAGAQAIVNDALGLTVDRYAEIQAAADREREKITEAARQEAEAAARAQAAAKANAQRQQDEWVANQNLIAQEKERLENIRDRLEAARAEKAALERRANQSFGKMQADFPQGISAEGYWAERSAARTRLNSDAFQAPLKALEKQLAAVLANIASMERAAPKMAVEMESAATKLDDQKKATAETLEKVKQTMEAGEIESRAKEIQSLEEARAENLKGILDQIIPGNEAAQAALDQARLLIADGELTANETKQANNLLALLMQGIRGASQATNENISRLITEMQTLSTRQASEAARIDRLQRQIKAYESTYGPQAPR